jgi:hypothetical protein
MTREELLALPAPLAVRMLVEYLNSDGEMLSNWLADRETPKQPRSPKYDFRIRRKGGYAWASETDLDGLRFWCGKYRESESQGTEYSERDGKNADKLSYWIAWREVSPKEQWTGQRNDEVVTAAVPSHKPRIYEWEARREAAPAPAAPWSPEEEETDDIPF